MIDAPDSLATPEPAAAPAPSPVAAPSPTVAIPSDGGGKSAAVMTARTPGKARAREASMFLMIA